MRTYAKPKRRNLPPRITHQEMADLAGITKQKLQTFRSVPGFPAVAMTTRNASGTVHVWYSKPEALAFIAKHLTVKA